MRVGGVCGSPASQDVPLRAWSIRSPRTAPRVLAILVALAAGGGATASAQDGGTTTPEVNAFPPDAARIVGKPVVLRMTPTQRSGVQFIQVVRTSRPVRDLTTDINGYSSDGGAFRLLARPGAPCYWARYSGFGTVRDGRIVWTISDAVAHLRIGSRTPVRAFDTSDPTWWDVSKAFPPETSFVVRVRSPRGRLRTATGQYSLRNPRAQRELRTIGCHGRIRPSALRY